MKKRIFVLALCLVLLFSSLSLSSSAATPVSFIAINDTLPAELVNCYTVYGGTVYVPCWIFNSYGLGVYYSYIDANHTAHIYSGTNQLFFEIDTGLTYDGNDNYYSLPGIMLGGTIYVPLSYISSFFGTFYYSQLSTPYGSLLRIKDARAVLSDSEFVQAADPQLRQYYSQRQPSQPEETGPDHEGTELLLSFEGLPGDSCFELLDSHGMKACFFLSAEDVLASPDTVRRIDTAGHSLGVLCKNGTYLEYERCADLMFEAARVRPILVSAPEDASDACEAMSSRHGLAHCARGMDFVYTPDEDISPYGVTSTLDISTYGTSLFLACGEDMAEDLRIILGFIDYSNYAVSPPSEVNN